MKWLSSSKTTTKKQKSESSTTSATAIITLAIISRVRRLLRIAWWLIRKAQIVCWVWRRYTKINKITIVRSNCTMRLTSCYRKIRVISPMKFMPFKNLPITKLICLKKQINFTANHQQSKLQQMQVRKDHSNKRRQYRCNCSIEKYF